MADEDPLLRRPVIDFVRLDNQSALSDEYVASRVNEIQFGQPLDIDNLELSIARIYGTQLFQKVGYQLVEDGDRTGVLAVGLADTGQHALYFYVGRTF
jgi:hypothetical protein